MAVKTAKVKEDFLDFALENSLLIKRYFPSSQKISVISIQYDNYSKVRQYVELNIHLLKLKKNIILDTHA